MLSVVVLLVLVGVGFPGTGDVLVELEVVGTDDEVVSSGSPRSILLHY